MVKRLSWLLLFAISALAVISLSTGAAHQRSVAQLAPDPTCSGAVPCIEYQNTGTGPGLEGTAKSDPGLWGVSTSGAGVRGNSTSANGVYGISTSGAGLRGSSTSSYGVYGISTKSYGVFGTSTNNAGVVGTSSKSNGVFGQTTNDSSVTGLAWSGVQGVDETGVTGQTSLNSGVDGYSTNGIGVQGSSLNFVGVNAVGGLFTGGSVQYPALSIVGTTSCSPSCSFDDPLIEACPSGTANPCDNANAVFYLDPLGDINISGVITTSGSCKTGCITQPHLEQQRVRFYTPRESLPTVEDFGEAQLTAGHAYVRIDPAFADTIDQQSNYLVFITPEGPSRGLYVTAKTATGFEVRENPGGQSTLAFQYRIVAKPYGENAPRLQRFTIHLPRPSLGNNNMLHPSTVAPVR
jgi:hypothetical protein